MKINSKHLIHIGFPKAGSSFLQEWFEKHADFQYINGGIAGFSNLYHLANEGLNSNIENIKYFVTSYEGLALPRHGAGRIWKKEIEYSDRTLSEIKKNQERICAILKNLIPEAKVLIITRGYKGFILSAYSQLLRTGNVLDFASMKESITSQECNGLFNYDDLINLYSGTFGNDNIIVLPYELLKEDKSAFVKILEEQLNVNHCNIVPGVVNPSLTKNEMFWYLKLSRLVSRVLKLGGDGFYSKYYEKYAVRLFFGRFNPLIKVASRIFPKKVLHLEISEQVLRSAFKGEKLKENPLFLKYSKEYFFD